MGDGDVKALRERGPSQWMWYNTVIYGNWYHTPTCLDYGSQLWFCNHRCYHTHFITPPRAYHQVMRFFKFQNNHSFYHRGMLYITPPKCNTPGDKFF